MQGRPCCRRPLWKELRKNSATITAQDAAFLNTPTAARISRLFLTIPIRTSVTSSAFPMPMTLSTFRAAPAFHIHTHKTIYGTQYHYFPTTKAPLIADMSSDIMSRKVDVSKFGMIYAGAQKNLGPSGLALVIIRKDLVGRTPEKVPTMLKYSTYTENNSLYNTPPTFGIYMIGLVTDWIREVGGLEAVEKMNDAKAALLYQAIDESNGYYSTPVKKCSRSKMNVVFRLPTEELEAKFLEVVKANGMIGLKGHRSVGGMRASIYNAMPLEGVEKLVGIMNDFRKNN